MPFIFPGSRKGGRLLGALVGAVMCLALPASASAGILDVVSLSKKDKDAALNLLDCKAQHDLGTPFSPWGDANLYAKAPGGDFEGLLGGGWTGLGLNIVEDNEPWHVGSATDSHAIQLVGEQSVDSPAMCIDATFPFFRFFARNVGPKKDNLDVYVTYVTRNLKTMERKAGSVKSDGSGWFLSDPMEIKVEFGSDQGAAAPVSFRFSSDKGGDWRIDDLYVDPFAKR